MAKTQVSTLDKKALDYIRENDLRWWLNRVKVAAARKEVEAVQGSKVKPDHFREVITDNCKWYMTMKRKSATTATHLTAMRWERLTRALRSLLPILSSVDLDDAVKIVCTACRCNKSNLLGLPMELRVWGRDPEQSSVKGGGT